MCYTFSMGVGGASGKFADKRLFTCQRVRYQRPRFHCMSPPSDKNSTLLPTQDHVDAPKRIAVIRDKKIILASILTVLIVSSAALILATIALAKLSSDLARLDVVNAGLNARLDQLGS